MMVVVIVHFLVIRLVRIVPIIVSCSLDTSSSIHLLVLRNVGLCLLNSSALVLAGLLGTRSWLAVGTNLSTASLGSVLVVLVHP